MHAALAGLVLALAAAPQTDRRAKALEDFKQDRERVLVECGQRHLEYGLELRDKGLVLQAATQITLSVDASEGRNPNAAMVLGLMRHYEDRFWKRRPRPPSRSSIEAYERKARKLRIQDQDDRLDLARRAERRGLDEPAYREVREVLLARDEPLEFDEKGRLLLEGGMFDGPLVERVRENAITINGLLYPRDSFLQRLPDVLRIFEAVSPRLRVRSTTSAEEAREIHAACEALLPLLDAELGATPERRLQVAVLHERATYHRYLDVSNLSSHRSAAGFADRLAGTAVLCSEDLTPERLLGLALHELTHLHQLCVSPAAFPSWYMEGCAEAHGGEGAYAWDGETLTTRATMAPERLDELRAKRMTVRELVEADALALLASDPDAARRFYTQSWALVRFLEQGAGEDVAERLASWRETCLGSIAGADLFRAYAMDSSKSHELFLAAFGEDLDELDERFGAWLEGL